MCRCAVLCRGLCWRTLENVDERAACRHPELQVRSFLTHAWKLGASANALACFASLFLSANTLSAVLALCWIAVVCIVPAVVFGKHLFRAVGDDWRRPGHGKWSWSGTVRHVCLLRRRMMWRSAAETTGHGCLCHGVQVEVDAAHVASVKTAEEKLKAHSGHFYEVVKPLTSALRVHMSYFWMLILLYESLKVRPVHTRMACLAS